MNKPTDYPVQAQQSETAADKNATDITYAQLKDRVDAKQMVTDEMIRTARAKLDAAYLEKDNTESAEGKFSLGNIRDRFRTE